jgi:DEAD/DEAH box helicase domain-containing protein
MDTGTFVNQIRKLPGYRGQVVHVERLPARLARFGRLDRPLPDVLQAALARAGVDRLYSHQAQAINAVRQGQHVILSTGTASGKTLAYNVPVLEALLADRQTRALYLFPTKALTQDQLAELDGLKAALGPVPHASGGQKIETHAYDGDTPQDQRARIRKAAQILVSNPDMLHTGILPHHTRWATFFQGLRYVVLDEVHTYRGVFGSHVANAIRRLKRVCAFYGSAPQFICCSATIANPLELAERLTEESVTLIDEQEDGSPKGEKHLLFYNPPLVDRDLGIRRNAIVDARLLAERFLGADIQTIVFARSRLVTEVLLTYLRRAAQREGQPVEMVQGYRGGYLPTERRKIERGLRERQIVGVVATNALELGINIGHLDACIMTGYPGTIASTWQQVGRAGRRTGVSTAILVAGASPLDQYIVNHPRYFFGRSPEHALLNPDNLAIVVSHIQCAAFELPFAPGEQFGRFPHTQEVLEFLAEEEGILRQSGGQWHWTGDTYPAEAVSLRAAELDNFIVADTSQGGTTIGVMDRQGVPRMLHEGAIYLHGGESYLVDRLDWDGRRAEVKPVEVDYYTQASVSETVKVLEVDEQAESPGTLRAHGPVTVTSKATSYKKIRLYTHETLGWGEISPDSVPELEMQTTAYWFSIMAGQARQLEQEGLLDMSQGDRGPNWEQQRNLVLERDGHRCRHCGAPERPDRTHDVHHVQPFRTFGYVRGENDRYLQANRLENLVTLCRSCHQRVEVDQMVRGTLAGVAYLLRHIAPLHLMSGPTDIGVVSEVRSSPTVSRLPTITIYDNAPGGLGFSQALYDLHDTLLLAARDVITTCGCPRGCPSCVGPVAEVGEDAKANCLRLLEMLLG